MDLVRRAREVLDIEMEAIAAVRDRLNAEFTTAVERMLACLSKGGKIAVSGVGKNYHIAQKISATLASTGSTSVVLNPMQAMHGDLGILSAGDILLVLSYSGESDELLSLVPIVRRLGVDVIAMTGSADSTLARLSDVTIAIAVPREACPFNMAPTASTTAALAVGDALSMVLLEARGFKLEDYAKLHPGGTIGRTLLLRVADIMRTGGRVASVPESALVKDAVVAMTKARAGSACIVDGEGILVGIVTDGDLRRHMPNHTNLLGLPAASIMTHKPIRVTVEQLAVDVLRVFEKHEIDDIPVVDGSGRLAGVVDSQDLPRFKLM